MMHNGEIGFVIPYQETPSTSEFYFIVEKGVRKHTYVITESKVVGIVEEVFKANEYMENYPFFSRISSFDEVKKHIPFEEAEQEIARVSILCSFDNEAKRNEIPPSPGEKVFVPDTSILSSMFGFDDNGLNIGEVEQHSLPVKLNITKLFQKHLAILAMSGAGKSHLVSVFMEELLKKEKAPAMVVFDIHGEYKYLKASKFYKKVEIISPEEFGFTFEDLREGIAYHLFPSLSEAGKRLLDKVLALKPKTLEEFKNSVAKLTSKNPRKRETGDILLYYFEKVSDFFTRKPFDFSSLKLGHLYIVDLSSYAHSHLLHFFVTYFLHRLFELRKRDLLPPVIIFVEEAHNFANQQKIEEMTSRKLIERIAREGRKFGVSLVLISQRPAYLSTTALSQCNTTIVLRITNPRDLEHIRNSSEWIDEYFLRSIPSFSPGDALLIGEAVRFPLIFHVRDVEVKREIGSKTLEEMVEEYAKKEEEKKKEEADVVPFEVEK